MTARLALFFSLIAAAAAVTTLALVLLRLPRLTGAVDRIERRLATPPPAPVPPTAAPVPEDEAAKAKTRRDVEQAKILQGVKDENEARLVDLVKKLGLAPAKEKDVRAAFVEEFAYYLAGVERSLALLRSAQPKAEDNWLATDTFRKGLEERIAATDEKVHDLLTAFQNAVFEQWRREIRRNRYELD